MSEYMSHAVVLCDSLILDNGSIMYNHLTMDLLLCLALWLFPDVTRNCFKWQCIYAARICDGETNAAGFCRILESKHFVNVAIMCLFKV